MEEAVAGLRVLGGLQQPLSSTVRLRSRLRTMPGFRLDCRVSLSLDVLPEAPRAAVQPAVFPMERVVVMASELALKLSRHPFQPFSLPSSSPFLLGVR